MLGYAALKRIEQKAQNFRKNLNMEHETYISLFNVLARLKNIYPRFSYNVLKLGDLINIEAQFYGEEQKLLIRYDTFQALKNNGARARWTIAHELGHLVLEHKHNRRRSTVLSAAEKFHFEIKREEAEARLFAGMFLAPSYLVNPNESADEIADIFGMSRASSFARRCEINTLEGRSTGTLRELPPSAVEYLRERQLKGSKIEADLNYRNLKRRSLLPAIWQDAAKTALVAVRVTAIENPYLCDNSREKIIKIINFINREIEKPYTGKRRLNYYFEELLCLTKCRTGLDNAIVEFREIVAFFEEMRLD